MITKEYRKKWREIHREYIKKYDREWRKENPERCKAIWIRYIHTEKGKKKIEEYRRNVRAFNWKRYAETSRRWQKNNPERVNFYCRIRRYLEKNNQGYHTLKEWEELKRQYNYTCLCCKKSEPEIKLTEDHIVPLSKGGSNNIENIQPLCKSCNRKKMTKIKDYRFILVLN